MKIATWNCHMAFRKKAQIVLANKPDIIVVPECEHPDKLIFKEKKLAPKDIVWYGSNINKGLGVLSYSKYKIKLLDIHDASIKTILPLEISNSKTTYIVLAIWAHNPDDPVYNYVGQTWKAVEKYQKILSGENVILTGDFNSNVFWDKLKRRVTHSMLVKRLDEMKIYSCYHHHYKIEQGAERHPTFYLYRHEDKPYHLDYCFVSKNLVKKIKKVEIGSYDDWCNYSDHCPLFVTLKD